MKEREIDDRVQKIIKKYNFNHFFVSAKTNEGIENLFFETVKNADDLGYINDFNINHRDTVIQHSNSTTKIKNKKKDKGCC